SNLIIAVHHNRMAQVVFDDGINTVT
ncbi:hypothetical protein D027_1744B, partial [Vibrio parahaemolyticus 861]